MGIGALSGGFLPVNPLSAYASRARLGVNRSSGQPEKQTSGFVSGLGANPGTRNASAASPGELLNVLASRSTLPASQLSPASRASRGRLNPETLAAYNEKLKGDFQQKFDQFLRKNGIETQDSIELEADAAGNLKVADDHPEADRINQLLENEDELRNLFSALSANAALQAALQEHAGFSKAFAADPQNAIGQFSNLFDNPESNPSAFGLRVTGNEIEILSGGIGAAL